MVRPGLAREFRDQPSLAGHDQAVIDQDVELSVPPLLHVDGDADLVADQRGVTRRVIGRGRSSRAIDDANAHGRKYTGLRICGFSGSPVHELARSVRGSHPAPLGKAVQTRSVGDLSLAGAVGTYGEQLEAAGRHDPVERDLPAVQ